MIYSATYSLDGEILESTTPVDLVPPAGQTSGTLATLPALVHASLYSDAPWWGDAYPGAATGDRFGSRLRDLYRKAPSRTLLAEAQEIAREALQWLITDGIADSVTAEAERIQDGIAIQVEVARSGTSPRRRYADLWAGLEE